MTAKLRFTAGETADCPAAHWDRSMRMIMGEFTISIESYDCRHRCDQQQEQGAIKTARPNELLRPILGRGHVCASEGAKHFFENHFNVKS
jgi:hypothetical protein